MDTLLLQKMFLNDAYEDSVSISHQKRKTNLIAVGFGLCYNNIK